MDASQARTVLEAVHPILMENVLVSEDGKLSLKNRKLIWIRRGCWEPGEIRDPPHTI